MNAQTLPKCFSRVVLSLLEDMDTPRALTVRCLIDNGEWDQLLNLKVNPAQYLDSLSYFKDVQATELLRKCKDIPGTSDMSRREAALTIFLEAERLCKRTNDRFDSHIFNGPFESPNDVRVHDILARVKIVMSSILGFLPKDLIGRHGKGATFSDPSRRSTIPDKMSSRPTITPDAVALLPFWERTAWCRSLLKDLSHLSSPEIVRGDRFATAPKDALKDRGTCTPPSINIFLQLAIAKVMRKRIRQAGIDLDSCQPKHKQVACAASLSGRFATIDLSSASDTVSFNLVKFLTPEAWFEVLSALRAPFTFVKGRWHKQEKFSSMGNGYTFELETLIFLSLAVVACQLCDVEPEIGKNVHVFGDDIIVPTEVSSCLLAMLRYCGFIPNVKKTFTTGVFRESCGGDFWSGAAVRPHYVKEFPSEPQDWIKLANGLRRVAAQYFGSDSCGFHYRRARFRAIDNLPTYIRRLRGPSDLGDCLIHESDQEKWRVRTINWISYVQIVVPITSPIPLTNWGPWTQLAAALYGVSSDGVVPRDAKPLGHRLVWTTFMGWAGELSNAGIDSGEDTAYKKAVLGYKPDKVYTSAELIKKNLSIL